MFLKYGCKVVQGVLTESQQQLELGQLLHLKEILGDATPQPVISRIIDAMYISNKEELKEDIAKLNEAQQQQQQQMQQLQMQQLQVDNQTKIAYAHSQEGLAQERIAKIQLDKALNVERINRAEEDKTASVLNLIKAVKELQGIDLQHLQQGLDIVNTLEGKESAEAGQIKQKTGV